jgi:hypothetical protein
LSEEKLQEAVDLLNNKGTKQNGLEWSVLDYNYHFTNNESWGGRIFFEIIS